MKPQRLGLLLGTVSLCWACSEGPDIRPLSPGLNDKWSLRADNAYEEGKEHLRAGRNGLAIVYFEQALAADPASVKVLNAIGTAYDQLHKYEIAQGFYTTALKLDPRTADSWNNMAVSLRMSGAPEAARKFLAEALKLDPANQTINTNMAALSGPAPEPKVVAAASAAPAVELASAEDEARPQLRRAGPREYDLDIPAGAGIGRYDERQGALPATLHIDVTRLVVPPSSPEYVRAVPVGRVTAIALLPPPQAEAVAVLEAAAPATTAPAPKAETVATVDTPATATVPPPPKAATLALLDMPTSMLADPAALLDPSTWLAATAVVNPVSERHPSPKIEVFNSAGRRHMAARMRSFLGEHGIAVATIGDARPFNETATVVTYRQGWESEAEALARLLPCAASIKPDDTTSANIRVALGRDLSTFDQQLENLHADQN